MTASHRGRFVSCKFKMARAKWATITRVKRSRNGVNIVDRSVPSRGSFQIKSGVQLTDGNRKLAEWMSPVNEFSLDWLLDSHIVADQSKMGNDSSAFYAWIGCLTCNSSSNAQIEWLPGKFRIVSADNRSVSARVSWMAVHKNCMPTELLEVRTNRICTSILTQIAVAAFINTGEIDGTR